MTYHGKTIRELFCEAGDLDDLRKIVRLAIDDDHDDDDLRWRAEAAYKLIETGINKDDDCELIRKHLTIAADNNSMKWHLADLLGKNPNN